MVPDCYSDSLEQHFSGFELGVFPSPRLVALPKWEISILTITGIIYIFIYIYERNYDVKTTVWLNIYLFNTMFW